jgi:hypothetical protein
MSWVLLDHFPEFVELSKGEIGDIPALCDSKPRDSFDATTEFHHG